MGEIDLRQPATPTSSKGLLTMTPIKMFGDENAREKVSFRIILEFMRINKD